MRSFPVLALAALLVLPLAATSVAQDAPVDSTRRMPPTLRVSGSAEVSAEPDQAIFEVGAQIEDPSASKAMSQVAAISDRLITALKQLGIPQEAMQTTELTLSQYDRQDPINPEPGQNVRHYHVFTATHLLQIRVGKDRFDRIGDYLDAALQAGANNIGNIEFGIKDDTSLRERGLADAVKNAREKADIMAQAAGVHIRGVHLLEEGEGPIRPVPMMENRMMAMSASAPQPIAPSEIRRTYSVEAEYDINP